jgi:tetratricopeptide (TPR) repeat protein
MRVAKTFSMLVWPMLLGATPILAFQQSQQQTAPPSSQSQQTNSQQTPAPTAQPAKKPTTADENPFPEDISRKAAQGDDSSSSDSKPPTSPAKPGSPGAAPSDADSSSRSEIQGEGDLGDNGNRISNGAGGYIVNPKLASEDVRVGGFYLDRHDYKGAYLRYKEASLADPENADAVFGLAEAARGLSHKDEAAQNYRIYLDVVPDGKKAKEARKALAELGIPTVAKK